MKRVAVLVLALAFSSTASADIQSVIGGKKLKAVQKASLQPFGISDGYPAPASITTLTFRTTSEDERPQVQYVRPYE